MSTTEGREELRAMYVGGGTVQNGRGQQGESIVENRQENIKKQDRKEQKIVLFFFGKLKRHF